MAIVLKPRGKLDLVGSTTLQQKFEKVVNLAANNQKLWVIDLNRVEDINHFGLTTLVSLRRLAAEKGCRLFLRNLSSQVQLMLDIAHLSEEFDILPHDTAVVGEYSGSSGTQTQTKTYRTDVSIEPGSPEEESKQAQSQAIGNIRKILTNIKTKLPDESEGG